MLFFSVLSGAIAPWVIIEGIKLLRPDYFRPDNAPYLITGLSVIRLFCDCRYLDEIRYNMCNISGEITLKRKNMKAFISRCVLVAATLYATGLVAEAQLGKNLLNKVVQNASEKQVSVSDEANTNVNANTNVFNGKAYYVSIEKGSARAAGTKDAPMKDIQKAIDSAADGDVIRIAQGNYLGPMDPDKRQICQPRGRMER